MPTELNTVTSNSEALSNSFPTTFWWPSDIAAKVSTAARRRGVPVLPPLRASSPWSCLGHWQGRPAAQGGCGQQA